MTKGNKCPSPEVTNCESIDRRKEVRTRDRCGSRSVRKSTDRVGYTVETELPGGVGIGEPSDEGGVRTRDPNRGTISGGSREKRLLDM